VPLNKAFKIWETLKLKQGIYARLPKQYLCSLEETTQASPFHWKVLGVKYRANPKTGHKERVQDVPIPIYYPPESQDGLWGGEGWISGFRYDKLSTRLERVWKPQLFTRELYSEILNHKLTITVTARTLDLIDAAFGFDYYILRTPKEDLNSKLGMDLRWAMLLRLAFKDTQIYTKYKQFEITAEEAEWVGLSVDEAVEKQRQLEHKPGPLFKSCVENLVKELAIQKLNHSWWRKSKGHFLRSTEVTSC
uniref:Large ribosomal subunit protein bL28m n=1 Tax=Salmo trutta TaxID=8032 RepID=A0A674A2E8_SALTR